MIFSFTFIFFNDIIFSYLNWRLQMISISKDKNTIKLLEIEKKSLNSMLDIQKI